MGLFNKKYISCSTGVPEREKEVLKKIFEEIVSEKLPTLVKDTNL